MIYGSHHETRFLELPGSPESDKRVYFVVPTSHLVRLSGMGDLKAELRNAHAVLRPRVSGDHAGMRLQFDESSSALIQANESIYEIYVDQGESGKRLVGLADTRKVRPSPEPESPIELMIDAELATRRITLVDQHGNRLQHAQYRLWLASAEEPHLGSLNHEFSAYGSSTEDGEVVLGPFLAGDYIMRIQTSEGSLGVDTVRMTKALESTPHEIVVPTSHGAVELVVRGNDGSLISGVTLLALLSSNGKICPVEAYPSDRSGIIRLSSAPVGSWHGLLQQNPWIRLSRNQIVATTISPSFEITARESGRVECIVEFGADLSIGVQTSNGVPLKHQPVSLVQVDYSSLLPVLSFLTDGEVTTGYGGRYVWHGLPPGPVRVIVGSPDAPLAEREIMLEPNQRHHLEIELPAAAQP